MRGRELFDNNNFEAEFSDTNNDQYGSEDRQLFEGEEEHKPAGLVSSLAAEATAASTE